MFCLARSIISSASAWTFWIWAFFSSWSWANRSLCWPSILFTASRALICIWDIVASTLCCTVFSTSCSSCAGSIKVCWKFCWFSVLCWTFWVLYWFNVVPSSPETCWAKPRPPAVLLACTEELAETMAAPAGAPASWSWAAGVPMVSGDELLVEKEASWWCPITRKGVAGSVLFIWKPSLGSR